MYYQVLVNKKHKYSQEMFMSRKLITTKDIESSDVQLEESTYYAYERLRNFIFVKEGLSLGIDSGYRSVLEQQQIFDEFVSRYGKDYAEKIVAPVGASEHHTGLCLDFSIEKDGVFPMDNNELMMDVERYKKIVPYLARFGFILRYPEGKEEITAYPYEPWHIRYVGVELAEKLYQENLTLEEYYQNLSGVLLIDKEKNMTSRDVVNIVSKYFYTKKVGHTGTLDPLATGALVITLGRATRIGELLSATNKEYIATVQLGIKTDTLDITGKVLEQTEVRENLPLLEVLKSFQKTYLQEVPLYSAVKVKGKKLYEYARSGKQVELPKKEVTIEEIELLHCKGDTFTFRCVVSKGTYIRSLIRDIGVSLGVPATMTNLRRVKQGIFDIAGATTLEEIRNGKANLLSMYEALRDYPMLEVSTEVEKKVKNGQTLKNIESIQGPCVILNHERQVLAIYQGKENILKPWKVLTSSND